jgi:hypothetical protein
VPGPLSPGVHLGAWRIVTVGGGGLAGAHHAAIALAFPGGLTQVSELLGWRRQGGQVRLRNEVVTDTLPAYGGGSFSAYRWVQLAGPGEIRRFQLAIERARQHLHGDLYAPADSNRFVGDVLYHAGYRLSETQRQALGGWVPDLKSPHL